MPRKKSNFTTVRNLALALPNVVESTIHGEPSLKVRSKLLACPAMHKSAEPDTLAVRIDVEQREALIAAEPEVYYVTDHYVNRPIVLVRLAKIERAALKKLIEAAWRFMTAKATRPTP